METVIRVVPGQMTENEDLERSFVRGSCYGWGEILIFKVVFDVPPFDIV